MVVPASVAEARHRDGQRLPPHLNVRRVRKRGDWWAFWPRYSCWATPPMPAWTFDRRSPDPPAPDGGEDATE